MLHTCTCCNIANDCHVWCKKCVKVEEPCTFALHTVHSLRTLTSVWQHGGQESARREPDKRKWEGVVDIFQILQLDNGPINLFIVFQSAAVLHFFSCLTNDRINFYFFLSSLIFARRSSLESSHWYESYNGVKTAQFQTFSAISQPNIFSLWLTLFVLTTWGKTNLWIKHMVKSFTTRWKGLNVKRGTLGTVVKSLLHFKAGWSQPVFVAFTY